MPTDYFRLLSLLLQDVELLGETAAALRKRLNSSMRPDDTSVEIAKRVADRAQELHVKAIAIEQAVRTRDPVHH
jgi:hypothetical protein